MLTTSRLSYTRWTAGIAWMLLASSMVIGQAAPSSTVLFTDRPGTSYGFPESSTNCTATDAEGATWLLFRESTDGQARLRLRKVGSKLALDCGSAASAGLAITNDGKRISMISQSTADGPIELRTLALGMDAWEGAAEVLPFPPGSRLLDVSDDGKERMLVLACTPKTKDAESSIVAYARRPDKAASHAPILVASGTTSSARILSGTRALVAWVTESGNLRACSIDLDAPDKPRMELSVAANDNQEQIEPGTKVHAATAQNTLFLIAHKKGQPERPTLFRVDATGNRPSCSMTLPAAQVHGIVAQGRQLAAVYATLASDAKPSLRGLLVDGEGRVSARHTVLELDKQTFSELRISSRPNSSSNAIAVVRGSSGLRQGKTMVLPTPLMPETPPRFAQRFGGRATLGRTQKAQAESILSAIRWLVAHQDKDGRWDCDQFMKHDKSSTPSDGPGAAHHDIGVTALVLLCLLADGATLDGHEAHDSLRRGLKWLAEMLGPDGSGGDDGGKHIYELAIATMALCEAHSMSGSSEYAAPATAALRQLLGRRNPYGAWRYMPRDNDNDMSVTGWCVLACGAAEEAGLASEETELGTFVYRTIKSYMLGVTDHYGNVGYTRAGEGSARASAEHAQRFPTERVHAMTAIALHAVGATGLKRMWNEHANITAYQIHKLTDFLPVWNPKAGHVDEYYWMHGSYGLRHSDAKAFSIWQAALCKAVIPAQRSNGDFAGSWDPVGPWGDEGGRVYTTAMLCLALQANYRDTPSPSSNR
jgi:A-macroglobulin TED domain